jgi:hypothetical protein
MRAQDGHQENRGMLARPREKPGLDAILRGEVQLAVASQAAAERRRVGHEIEAAEHFHQLSRVSGVR